jgi:EAL and modified HD-GYP domain-containing signal transduction protein
VKQDLALSYKLLRYINSASLGLVSEVKSIGHALRILGHDKLLRWTAVYLLSLRQAREASPSAHEAIYATALQRARTMELLAIGRWEDGRRDVLFLVGMFSLMDALLGVSLEDALAEIRLPEGVSAALLHEQGPYAPYLDLVKAAEAMDNDRVFVLARNLRLSIDDVNRAQLEATHWMENVTHRTEPAHSTAA